ncbi:ferrous iron transport protein A [Methanosarcina barkeri]|uniref:ferrous iron transport protein A n=1 Tax=Methanosarcina barkeri TaxID=2208 RepID=UPI0006D0B924|nr:ferrous iron transport protein A [Methanosarcina barkeri]
MVTKNSHFDLKAITLCAMEPRKTGKIDHLETKNPGILQKLIAMGILPACQSRYLEGPLRIFLKLTRQDMLLIRK